MTRVPGMTREMHDAARFRRLAPRVWRRQLVDEARVAAMPRRKRRGDFVAARAALERAGVSFYAFITRGGDR